MFHHCRPIYNASPQSNQSGSFVPSTVRNSHNVSGELKMPNDYFCGLEKKLVTLWKVLSSSRAWDPELYFTLQVKWSLKSNDCTWAKVLFACSLQPKRSFSEGPIVMVNQKSEALNLTKNPLSNKRLQGKLCGEKITLIAVPQLPVPLQTKRRWRGRKDGGAECWLFLFFVLSC